jgi:glycerate 2-kinase
MSDLLRDRDAAAAIWATAIAAVDPAVLVARALATAGSPAGDIDLGGVDRIVVVGGGKAAATMAAGVERMLGPERLARHRVTGLVSVPAGCGRSLEQIEVRETRPAAVNLPTPDVVKATRDILERVGALGPRDLVMALVSGGGSACLAAPRDGVTLDEKIALTRRLAAEGADIATLNAARRRLSLVKGGGLARACTAGRLVALVLSDVIGDDLAVIASGPCLPAELSGVAAGDGSAAGAWTTPTGCRVSHRLIGSNATAVYAAAAAAAVLGYAVTRRAARPEARHESADEVGRRLAAEGQALLAEVHRDGQPRAVIEGGEATVQLPVDHGTGGRNQQTVLAALAALESAGGGWPPGLVIASVGTDGEDGPTDAAGAVADARVAAGIREQRLDLAKSLARCDAYPLFRAAGGLVVTGPTGTNVADVRIMLSRP